MGPVNVCVNRESLVRTNPKQGASGILVCVLLSRSGGLMDKTCLVSTFALLAACGGGGGSTDIKSTLTFADRTDAEISRLVSAASGSEGFQAEASVAGFDNTGATPDPCPAIAISGHTVNITGGCTTKDNVMIEGTASITNPLGWGDLDYDYGSDTTYEMQGLAFVQQNTRRSFDGFFTISSNFTVQDMDVTADMLGVAVRSDVHLECGRTSCAISGSGVELVGVGGARVSGTINISGNTATASYTLKGTDTVKVTMTNNCVSWTLEGTDRKFDPCTR